MSPTFHIGMLVFPGMTRLDFALTAAARRMAMRNGWSTGSA